MSTNKTTNYQLHSWLPSDEFHLTEINENFTALDAALKAEAGSAAQKQAALESAMETALGERVRMVTGSYTGKAANKDSTYPSAQVILGFKPKAVVIMATVLNISGPLLAYLAIEGGTTTPSVTLDPQGFTARNDKVFANHASTVYHYAAFY